MCSTRVHGLTIDQDETDFGVRNAESLDHILDRGSGIKAMDEDVWDVYRGTPRCSCGFNTPNLKA